MPYRKRRRTIKDDGPDPIDVYVGDRVKTLRKGLRISQTRLGDALGMSFQQVQKYENGMNRIGASNLLKISKTLGVDVEFFFEGIEDAVKVDAEPQGEIPDQDPMKAVESMRLVRDFVRIKDDMVRRRIRELFKELAKNYPDGDGAKPTG